MEIRYKEIEKCKEGWQTNYFNTISQYASPTTATVCDEVFRVLMKMRWQPAIQIVPHYESEPLYIDAIVKSINKKLSEIDWRPDLIVASYHGIPKKYFEKGDPYHCYCQKTTRLIAEKFKEVEIITTFQSRFGPQEWLQPYTDKTLENLPKEGKKGFWLYHQDLHQTVSKHLKKFQYKEKKVLKMLGVKNLGLYHVLTIMMIILIY